MQRVTISVQSREIFDQIYPTRRMPVWSKLLSIEDSAGRQLYARPGRNQRSLVRRKLLVKDNTGEGSYPTGTGQPRICRKYQTRLQTGYDF
jgi:hypothetical protein